MISIKRVYEPPDPSDGLRILVDRLWPRGLAKEKARIDQWQKDLAPSDALRRWFGHDPRRWEEFKRRYRQELSTKMEEVKDLVKQARHGTITLLFASQDKEHNNAVVFQELLEKHCNVAGLKRGARDQRRGRATG